MESTVASLTPAINPDAYNQVLEYYLFDQLVDLDPVTFNWMPRLAVRWQISPDMKTIDFWLRHGVTFSNGDPLTADDVVFTFDWIMNPAVEAPMIRSYLTSLVKAPGSDHYVEKLDDYHVRFHFSQSYFMSFDAVAYNEVWIMDKAFYSRYKPDDYNVATGLVMGAGPYRLADPTNWRPEPGKPIVLVRNERYYGPRPSFNKIIWKVIEDPTARATAFENGEVDFFGPGYFGPHAEQYMHVLADPAESARCQHFALDSPTVGYQFIGWNEKVGRDGPPSHFADPRVRRAMTMLIDRWKIVHNVQDGLATVVSGCFSPLSDQYDQSVKPWPYDPAAAEALLAQAGCVKHGDLLYDPYGKPFAFKLMYAAESDVGRRVAPMVHDFLAQAGILCTADPTEWTSLLKRIDDRQYDAVAMGESGAVPNNDPYQLFHSSQMAGTGDDFIQFADPDVDDLIVQARQVLDRGRRTELWHKFDRIMHEQEPETFMYDEKELSLIDKRVHGVEPLPLGLLWRIQEWYVPKALQKYSD